MKRMGQYSAEELRLTVLTAPAGTNITLPAGEYEGPLIIDRPLRLTGQGPYPDSVVIWATRGPAVIVRAAQVELTNLSVMLTSEAGRHHDPTVWYAPGCQPQVLKTEIEGRMELMGSSHNQAGWQLPELINLDELRPNYPVSLSLTIETPAATRLSAELAGIKISPAELPAGGPHDITLDIPKNQLKPEVMLAGQLILEAQGEVRTVWVIGRVLSETEFKQKWVQPQLILNGQNGHKYACGKGLWLGRQTLASEPGSFRLNDTHTYLSSDASQAWYLWQPVAVRPATKIDGQPLVVGQRKLLQGGEMIEIGALKLTVDQHTTSLPLTVADKVDFGKLSQQNSVALTVENNRSLVKWAGSLQATVPWIEIPQPQVTCAGGSTSQLPIQLSPQAAHLSPDSRHYPGALMLQGRNETWFIEARIEVDAPPEPITVQPRRLYFGRVTQPPVYQQLRLRNHSGADWQGTIQTTVPWLTVARSTLHCPAGQEITIELSLNDHLATLPEGKFETDDGLIITGQEISIPIGIKMIYHKPQVKLTVQPDRLDFGPISQWPGPPSQTIHIRNQGQQAWRGQVETTVPWLTVQPTKVNCPASDEVTLTVSLNEQLQKLSAGQQQAHQAIKIRGDDKTFILPAQLVIDPPPVRFDKTNLKLTMEADKPITQQLYLINDGETSWQGEISRTAPWLKVSPMTIVCPPEKQMPLNLTIPATVRQTYQAGQPVRDNRAVVVSGLGQTLTVGVHLEITEQQPEPDFLINFETVAKMTDSLPTYTFNLTNERPWPMTGRVYVNAPWLTVTPDTFSCPAHQSQPIKVQLTSAIRQLAPGDYHEPKAFIIHSGGQTYLFQVEFTLTEPASKSSSSPTPSQKSKKRPPKKPAATSSRKPTADDTIKSTRLPQLMVNFGTITDWSNPLPSRTLQIPNPSTTEPLTGTIKSTVTWLTVEPTRFSCPPNQTVEFTVRLTNRAKQLKPRPYYAHNGLEIETPQQKFTIPVQLEISRSDSSLMFDRGSLPFLNAQTVATTESMAPSPTSGKLTLHPTELDLGDFAKGDRLPSQTVQLSNGLATTWEGQARSTLPWLEVTPKKLSCPAGQTITLTVRGSQYLQDLRPRTYAAPDGLIIEGHDQKWLIGVTVTVTR